MLYNGVCTVFFLDHSVYQFFIKFFHWLKTIERVEYMKCMSPYASALISADPALASHNNISFILSLNDLHLTNYKS